jgi:hypothetical protein
MTIDLSNIPLAKPAYTDGNTGEDVYKVAKDSRDFDIGQKHWNDSQVYWRQAMLEKLPPPEPVADEESSEDML